MPTDPCDRLWWGKERAALYAESLADGAADIACGEETKSRHTRTMAMHILSELMQEVLDIIPFLPKAEGEDQVGTCRARGVGQQGNGNGPTNHSGGPAWRIA